MREDMRLDTFTDMYADTYTAMCIEIMVVPADARAPVLMCACVHVHERASVQRACVHACA